MKAKVYNQNGDIIEETELPSEIFGLKFNQNLIWQVVAVQSANKRNKSAHTKTRSEVSGSGRKIWAQKGLGRARHGDIRAPIFRHGGVAHGPRNEKIYAKQISNKMKRKAILTMLSAKFQNNEIILLNDLKIEKPKTKLISGIIKNLKNKIEFLKRGKILIILPKYDKNLILAVRNLKDIGITEARNLNCLELLSFKFLLIPKEAINTIKETFLK